MYKHKIWYILSALLALYFTSILFGKINTALLKSMTASEVQELQTIYVNECWKSAINLCTNYRNLGGQENKARSFLQLRSLSLQILVLEWKKFSV